MQISKSPIISGYDKKDDRRIKNINFIKLSIQ